MVQGNKVEIFLSYCWADEKIADKIYDYLVENDNINLHRDTIDIKKWGSIKEYMHSISQMDYTILLISDSYLKSSNCMYEVLEVMRDRNYKDKIFPAVINAGIYDPLIRINYVKYWQQKYEELNVSLKEINVQNIGKLGEDLKRRQDISSNIANFLDLVSDLNNPNIENICDVVADKLKKKGFINDITLNQRTAVSSGDLFAQMGIPKGNENVTDLEVNQFMTNSYQLIQQLFGQLCKQFEEENSNFNIIIEKIDTRNCLYQFYNNGKLIKALKLFLDNSFGAMNIGISNDVYSIGSNHSWNGMYIAKVVEGNLILSASMSFSNNGKEMSAEDVVKDIWINYIKQYIDD